MKTSLASFYQKYFFPAALPRREVYTKTTPCKIIFHFFRRFWVKDPRHSDLFQTKTDTASIAARVCEVLGWKWQFSVKKYSRSRYSGVPDLRPLFGVCQVAYVPLSFNFRCIAYIRHSPHTVLICDLYKGCLVVCNHRGRRSKRSHWHEHWLCWM